MTSSLLMPSETLRTHLLEPSLKHNLIQSAELWRVRKTTSNEDKGFWVSSEHLRPYTLEAVSPHRTDAPQPSSSTPVELETISPRSEYSSGGSNRKEPRPTVEDTLDAVRELGLNTSDVVFGVGILKIELRKMDDGTEYDLAALPTNVCGWPVKYTKLSDSKEPERPAVTRRKKSKAGEGSLQVFPRMHFRETIDAARNLRLNIRDFVFSNGSLKIVLEKMDDGSEYDLATLTTTINGWPVVYTCLKDKMGTGLGDVE